MGIIQKQGWKRPLDTSKWEEKERERKKGRSWDIEREGEIREREREKERGERDREVKGGQSKPNPFPNAFPKLC